MVLGEVKSIQEAISHDSHSQIEGLIKAGAIQALLSILQNDSCLPLRAQAAWCISNLTAGKPDYCSHILHHHGI